MDLSCQGDEVWGHDFIVNSKSSNVCKLRLSQRPEIDEKIWLFLCLDYDGGGDKFGWSVWISLSTKQLGLKLAH